MPLYKYFYYILPQPFLLSAKPIYSFSFHCFWTFILSLFLDASCTVLAATMILTEPMHAAFTLTFSSFCLKTKKTPFIFWHLFPLLCKQHKAPLSVPSLCDGRAKAGPYENALQDDDGAL